MNRRSLALRSLIAATLGVTLMWAAPANAAGPQASVYPSSLGFGDQQIGTTSGTQGVTVYNGGTSDLVITTVLITGLDSTQFVKFSDSCSGATLAAGATSSCQASIQFAPTSAGQKSATLEISSNDPNSPAKVSLSGNGVNPQASAFPTSLSFGNQQLGTPSSTQTVSVYNTGTGHGDIKVGVVSIVGPDYAQFTMFSDSCSNATLSPNGSCQVLIGFDPTTTGNKNATVQVPSNDPSSPLKIALTGNGVNPQASAFPSSISFGDQQLGTKSSTQTVSVNNSGTGHGDIKIGSVSIVGPDYAAFTVFSDSCTNATLPPNGTCSVAVEFSPSSVGSKSATLEVPSNDPSSPIKISLSGAGVNPQASVFPASLTFGNQQVGTTSGQQTVTLYNGGTGHGNITVGSVSIVGPDYTQFTIFSDSCSNATLAPNGSCSVSIEFGPTATGSKSATLQIPSNDPTSPAKVSLSGTGVIALQASPSKLGYGSVQLGQSSTKTTTITYRGSSSATFDTATISGANASDFTIGSDSCSSTTLGSGGSCQISVTFAPGALGSRSATLGITSDNGTLTVQLSGTGIDTLGPTNTWGMAANSVRISTLQNVNGNSADPSGVASVSIRFTDLLGSVTTVPATLSSCTPGNRSCDWSAAVPVMLPGPATATIVSSDSLGNISVGPSISLIVI